MVCCGNDEGHKPTEDEPIKKVQDRRCTDILCLIIFIAFWVGMFIIGGYAFNKGGFERLLYDHDSYGFQCGADNKGQAGKLAKVVSNTTDTSYFPDFKSRKKSYWINQLDFFSTTTIITGRKVCVESCPGENDVCTWGTDPSAVFTCSGNSRFTCPYARYSDYNVYGSGLVPSSIDQWSVNYRENITTSSAKGLYYHDLSLVWGEGPCYPNWTNQTDTLNRCLPQVNGVVEDALKAVIASGTSYSLDAVDGSVSGDVLQNSIGDLLKGILIVFVSGMLVAFGLAMIWLIILRYLSGFFVWLTVLAVNLIAVATTIYCSLKANLIHSSAIAVTAVQGTSELTRWKGFTWAAIAVTCFIFLVTILMIPRIRIAIAVLKVATQAVAAVPMVLFWPIVPLMFEVLLIVWWIFVMAFLFAAGTLDENHNTLGTSLGVGSYISSKLSLSVDVSQASTKLYSSYMSGNATAAKETACADSYSCHYSTSWNKPLEGAAIYHLFGLFWTNEFILGMGNMVLAMVFVQFYFFRGERARLPSRPVLSAFGLVVRKHLGSIAFGSFIVAVIKMIRFLVEQSEKQIKARMGTMGERAAKILTGCLKYCLWLLEKIMQFINKNAYIVVAITGRGYCWSAVHAVSLILKNILRFAAVNVIATALLWLGKIAVAAGATLVAFGMTQMSRYKDASKYPSTALSSPLLVIILSGVLAFFVAEIFFQVYDMGIDTILLCFCEDCEQNGDDVRYAPALLMEAIGKGKEVARRRAERKGAARADV